MATESWGLSLQAGLSASGMTYSELWVRQIAAGGSLSLQEVAACVSGLKVPATHQYNLLAQALNEYFIERGGHHPVAYQDETMCG